MSITIASAYISNADADTYFATRWPHTIWDNASETDKTAVLTSASEAIDRLNFAGTMASFQFTLTLASDVSAEDTVLAVDGTGTIPNGALFTLNGLTYAVASHTETDGNTVSITIASPGLTADASSGDIVAVYQARQFPRGRDTVIPQAILKATCELAYSLLDDVDPSIEIESLNITQTRIGNAESSFARTFAQPHILAGIPSIQAWHLLLPFLRDPNEVRLIRDSYKTGPNQLP